MSFPDVTIVDKWMPQQRHDRIERELERLILTGESPPGAHINEMPWRRLGVSRAPVREACRLLQRAGLVRIVPNQGACVHALSLPEIVEHDDVRACLGRFAGQQAAASIERSGRQELHALIAAMDAASSAADAERYIDLNITFHATLYAATGNGRLALLDAQMGKELRIYRRYGLEFGGGLAMSNSEHRALVAAIERGDCDAAGAQLEKHIQNGVTDHPRDVGDREARLKDVRAIKSSRRKA
jgi:DNA-binding GntR family transcriptional regulator